MSTHWGGKRSARLQEVNDETPENARRRVPGSSLSGHQRAKSGRVGQSGNGTDSNSGAGSGGYAIGSVFCRFFIRRQRGLFGRICLHYLAGGSRLTKAAPTT